MEAQFSRPPSILGQDERRHDPLFWSIVGTVGNPLCGGLVDRFPSRTIISVTLWFAIANVCALPWTSTHVVRTAIALTIWGVSGWGLIVQQQHRLVEAAPQAAPLVLALSSRPLSIPGWLRASRRETSHMLPANLHSSRGIEIIAMSAPSLPLYAKDTVTPLAGSIAWPL